MFLLNKLSWRFELKNLIFGTKYNEKALWWENMMFGTKYDEHLYIIVRSTSKVSSNFFLMCQKNYYITYCCKKCCRHCVNKHYITFDKTNIMAQSMLYEHLYILLQYLFIYTIRTLIVYFSHSCG